MKTKLLIVSAILGVSIYAIADVGSSLPTTSANTYAQVATNATSAAGTQNNTRNSGSTTNTNSQNSAASSATDANSAAGSNENADSKTDANATNSASNASQPTSQSTSSREGNLFDELLKIQAAYEDANSKIQQATQVKASTMNQWNVEAEKRQLELIQKEAELASLDRLLEQNRRSLINSLDAYSDGANNLFNQIQDQLQQQQRLAAQIDTLKREEKILRDRMKDNLAELSLVSRDSDALVLETKQKIRELVERKLNDPIRIQTEKAVQCSLNETLKSCMSKLSTKKAIVDPALYSQFAGEDNKQLFTQLDYTFLDFNYINAYQRMDGETYFKVDAKVAIQSSSEMFASLYSLVGLPETGVYRLILTSNRDATFYVNKTRVGHGQAVAVNVERGNYHVQATYQGRTESTKEHITESTSLYYGF